MTGQMHHLNVTWASILFLIASGFGLGMGCTSDQPGKEFQLRTDMASQPSFRHNEDPRPAPSGTVRAVGYEKPTFDSAAASLLKNPFVFSPQSPDSGKELFETYCFPCHGSRARGDGPVASKFQVPPDLTSEKYIRAPDGYIYSVIRYGVRIMPSHSENTTSRERWLIVSYLRSLQKQ
jgi:S-disulfanyl-L-cysteine oxidoreductase SoxD